MTASYKPRIAAMYVIFVIFTILVATGVALPFIYWHVKPDIPLNVWIIDKTVPTPDYREHKGLMWVLNHYKVVSEKTMKPFRYEQDYFGFFPLTPEIYDIRPIPDVKEDLDLIYITDTYGVYTDDYMIPNVRGTHSEIIYGGLQTDEMNIIRQNLHGNTIIGEFNIASSPTNLENRLELETVFGIKWVGWRGRYFRDLRENLEVPVWMVENYERQTGKEWKFTGPGFAIVSDADEVYIFEKPEHVGNKDLRIEYTDAAVETYGVKKMVPYYYWFEFTKPGNATQVLATYTLDVTPEGLKVLESLGLSPEFPAVYRFTNVQYDSYYFCGDFSDMQKIGKTWSYYGLAKIRRTVSADSKGDSDHFFWNCYTPMLAKIIKDIEEQKRQNLKEVPIVRDDKIYARTQGQDLQVLQEGKWVSFFAKGFNLGPALPGKWFTEFPKDEDLYFRWLTQMAAMNANCVRIYTLFPPEFYRAFLAYNLEHPDKPLWLYQEIWPEEHPPGNNYLAEDYNDTYHQEIEMNVDAIHGRANIPARQGRAYGIYTADVSRYVAGYLVGRELEAKEVIDNDTINQGFQFSGEYLRSIPGATPTEAWLAMCCDYVLRYEEEKYGGQHPVAIVSWPTMDPISHFSEWDPVTKKTREFNDLTSIDINNIDMGPKMRAGFFGLYHIYPNYPDFMNNEAKYKNYQDEKGRFMYGGYLQEFMAGHSKYPAVVGEFGMATGSGTAHANPDGYHHGGVTETQQGRGIVRMMEAIRREGYAGGLIFEWMDEWAKKTWTTEPFMIPYERQVFWHNQIDPEQNYGILTYEVAKPKETDYQVKGSGLIKQYEMRANAAYLYLDVTLSRPLDLSKESLLIGLDTYNRKTGEFKMQPSGATLPTGIEFLISIDGKDTARLLVQKSYNASKGTYISTAGSIGVFEEIAPIINKERHLPDGTHIPQILERGSLLRYGDFTDNNYFSWYQEGNNLRIRLPWGRINFTDPATMMVLNDPKINYAPLRDQLSVVKTDGIISYLSVINKDGSQQAELVTKDPFRWAKWNVPEYQERFKKSYKIIQDYFATLD
jgi:hypothetical protein